MATPRSHQAVPLALTAALGTDAVPPGLLARVCAVLPDLDALGLWLGFHYAHPFGLRGITHSLPVAVALAGAGTLPTPEAEPRSAFGVLPASAASHGLIDALTIGGLGIALLSPFSRKRFFPAVAGRCACPRCLRGAASRRCAPRCAGCGGRAWRWHWGGWDGGGCRALGDAARHGCAMHVDAKMF